MVVPFWTVVSNFGAVPWTIKQQSTVLFLWAWSVVFHMWQLTLAVILAGRQNFCLICSCAGPLKRSRGVLTLGVFVSFSIYVHMLACFPNIIIASNSRLPYVTESFRDTFSPWNFDKRFPFAGISDDELLARITKKECDSSLIVLLQQNKFCQSWIEIFVNNTSARGSGTVILKH